MVDSEGIHNSMKDEEPLIGRTTELTRLREGLENATRRQGSLWLVAGPVGIGKTRLVEEVMRIARLMGFTVLKGGASSHRVSSYHPFAEAFGTVDGRDQIDGMPHPHSRPPLLIIKEERPNRTWTVLASLLHHKRILVVSRETPHALRAKVPGLGETTRLIQFGRTEGPDTLSPTALDALGERVDDFLRQFPHGTVVVAHLEYLVVQNNFLSVLRLLQFLRELADSSGGQVIVSFNPEGFEGREKALLESEGEVISGKDPLEVQDRAQVSTKILKKARWMAYLEKLETLSKEHPVLLVLEDMGWADPASSGMLPFLARNSRHIPVMMVTSTRTAEWEGETTGNIPLNSALDALSREGLLSRIVLGPLPSAGILKMIEEILGGPIGRDARTSRTLTEMASHVGGNPLVATILAQRLMDDGILNQRTGAWTISDGTLKSGKDLEQLFHKGLRRQVLSLVDSLSKEERNILEMAATSGTRFDHESLSGALAISGEELLHILGRIEERYHLIRRGDPQGTTWDFSHPYFQEVISDEMPVERSQALSDRLSEWLIKARPSEVETIVRLCHNGREGAKRMPWFIRAIESALRNGDAEAVTCYSGWMLDHLDEKAEGMEGIHERILLFAEALALHGAHAESERLLREILRDGQTPMLALTTKRMLISVLMEAGKVPEAKALLTGTVKEFEGQGKIPNGEFAASLDILRAELEMRSGDPEAAYATVRDTLGRLGEKGSPHWRVRGLEQIGWSLLRERNIQEAERAFSEGRALSLANNLLPYLSYHSGGLGMVELARGNPTEALNYFEEAAHSSLELGNIAAAASELLHEAEALFLLKRLGEAEKVAMQSLQYSEKFDDLGAAGRAFLLLGRVKMESKDWEAARTHLSLAVNRFTLSGESSKLDEARLWMAGVSGEMGNPKGAIDDILSITSGGPIYHRVMSRLRELIGDTKGALEEMERLAGESSRSEPLEGEENLDQTARLKKTLRRNG